MRARGEKLLRMKWSKTKRRQPHRNHLSCWIHSSLNPIHSRMFQWYEPICLSNVSQKALDVSFGCTFSSLLAPFLPQHFQLHHSPASLWPPCPTLRRGVQCLLFPYSASWEPPRWQTAHAGNHSRDCASPWRLRACPPAGRQWRWS